MPKISEFYGIVIRMNFDEHPPPHFHAYYGGEKATVSVQTGEVTEGSLPPRARRLVKEWCDLHQVELEENWRRVEAGVPLLSIEPL
jgi:hypothetical protein